MLLMPYTPFAFPNRAHGQILGKQGVGQAAEQDQKTSELRTRTEHLSQQQRGEARSPERPVLRDAAQGGSISRCGCQRCDLGVQGGSLCGDDDRRVGGRQNPERPGLQQHGQSSAYQPCVEHAPDDARL